MNINLENFSISSFMIAAKTPMNKHAEFIMKTQYVATHIMKVTMKLNR